MNNVVIQMPKTKIEELTSYYSAKKVERQAPGVVFAAKLPDVSITAYSSGKVLFQGNGAGRESERWGQNLPSKTSAPIKAKGDKLPENFASASVIGSDETGTGDYFGPVTVAACYVRKDQVELVKELGVKDSKMLTDDMMRRIAPDLAAVLTHSVLTLKNEKYNEVQSRGWSQGKIKALLHNQALKHVLKKIAPEKPEYILIDQFAERGVYYNHIKQEPEIIKENVLFSTKAEQLHVSVAAASIFARVAFLKEMDRLSEIVGIELPKGAGPKVDEIAARLIMKIGSDSLKTMTKWHFANTNKAYDLVKKKRS